MYICRLFPTPGSTCSRIALIVLPTIEHLRDLNVPINPDSCRSKKSTSYLPPPSRLSSCHKYIRWDRNTPRTHKNDETIPITGSCNLPPKSNSHRHLPIPQISHSHLPHTKQTPTIHPHHTNMHLLLAIAATLALTSAAPTILTISIQADDTTLYSSERRLHALTGSSGIHVLCSKQFEPCHEGETECCSSLECWAVSKEKDGVCVPR